MIVLDANVVIEILGERSKADVARVVIGSHNAEQPLALSALTVSHVFWWAEKYKIPLARVEKWLPHYQVIDVVPNDVTWALKYYKQKDFEDALQIAVALRHGCQNFITLDADLAKKYRKHLNVALIQ